MDATNYIGSISILFLTLCLFVQKGLGIRCYTCNSYYHHEDCINLPKELHHLYELNCDELPGNKNYTRCRKMLQTYNKEVRIVRQCATSGDAGCRRRIGTHHFSIEYCECTEDYCNSAQKRMTSLPILFAIIILIWRLLM